MVLKRKRSDSEISTTSSILSSPISSTNLMSLDSFHGAQSIHTPSLFSSRTRKRHRDNRPDENAVHQHTLSLLFSAQQNPSPQQLQSQSPSAVLAGSFSSLRSSTQSSGQQSSLHSFWAIPSARQSSPSGNSSASSSNTPNVTPRTSQYLRATNCEDCDANLLPGHDGDAMDVDMMMDIDMSGDGGSHACSGCGRQVCHRCAVSNLGSERKCLLCAGKERKWVGGIGCY